MICDWCGEESEDQSYAQRKRFCSERCRRDFHQALRSWGLIGYDSGLITIDGLRNVFFAVRARTKEKDRA